VSEEVFLLPDVGEGLVEAEIVEWKVKVGDEVSLNQPLVDIVTAKATVELPSPFAGTVRTLHARVGDVLEVHTPLVTFEVAGQVASEAPAPSSVGEGREAVLVGYGVANEDAAPVRRRRTSSLAPRTPALATTINDVLAPASSPRCSPPVRLYAKQRGLDLANVVGTGRDGLITREDVDRAAGRVAPATSAPRVRSLATTSRLAGQDLAPWSTGPDVERIPVRGVLRSMADAMTQSAFSAPHAAVWVRLDATKTVELLEALRARPSLVQVRVTPLVIVALALMDAARTYPGINSYFDAETHEVVVQRHAHLGVAVDSPRGLVVPNVKNADRLGFVEMAEALDALVRGAREGTTAPADMMGTTLTITNVGPLGVDAATPILPPRTSAILALGRFVKAPWVVDDEIVVRHVGEVAMSFDHRHVDGATASRALRHVADFLEDPAPRLLAP